MTRARVDHVLESLASRSEFESLPVGQTRWTLTGPVTVPAAGPGRSAVTVAAWPLSGPMPTALPLFLFIGIKSVPSDSS